MTDIQCVDCGKYHMGECEHPLAEFAGCVTIEDMAEFDKTLKQYPTNPLELIAEYNKTNPRRTVILTYDNSGWRLMQEFRAIGTNETILERINNYSDTDELIKGIKGIYGKE